MHSIIGHDSINDTSVVLTYCLMIKRIISLGILGICIRISLYATADADEEDIIFCEKGTVESEYDDEFNHGED